VDRTPLPLDRVLAILGLTAELAGDDPMRPTHLRLRAGGRAILWPLEPHHGDPEDEMLLAVADMLANASHLGRSGYEVGRWAQLVLLDERHPRTQAAFDLALVLDELAESLLTRPVIHGLLAETAWRRHLERPRPIKPPPSPVEETFHG
jgi:hypothetical protein